MSPECSPVSPGIRRAALSIVILSGLCSCLHHYHFIREPKTWTEARKYCREKYTDLAKVDNMEDMKRLIATADRGYEGKVWIGLYDRDWVWIHTKYYGNGHRNFRKWNKGEPNDMRKNVRLCVAFWQGFWYDNLVSDPHTFVCANSTTATDNGSYIFINRRMTWGNAHRYCLWHHKGLATVRSHTENTRIREVVPDNQMAWIGMYRDAWTRWSDKTYTIFNNWADGHPLLGSGRCAASVINATRLGKWVENHCDEKFHFMCHNNKKQVFIVKLKLQKSTIDPNDPAVIEAILNLIEEKMKEKGITRDVKLSWKKKPNENMSLKEKKANVVKTDL